MLDKEQKSSLTFLIVDDEKPMTEAMLRAVKAFNKGELLTNEEAKLRNVRFEPTVAKSHPEVSDNLKGKASVWDIMVIDRKFPEHEDFNCNILIPLRDLGVKALKIIWTGYPDPSNLINCMRLGAWDYIDKNQSRHGNPCKDVIISALEGLEARRIEAKRAENVRLSSEFIRDNEVEIYKQYRGKFVAFEKDENGNWKLEAVAQSDSCSSCTWISM